jgi:hypothetical protein
VGIPAAGGPAGRGMPRAAMTSSILRIMIAASVAQLMACFPIL